MRRILTRHLHDCWIEWFWGCFCINIIVSNTARLGVSRERSPALLHRMMMRFFLHPRIDVWCGKMRSILKRDLRDVVSSDRQSLSAQMQWCPMVKEIEYFDRRTPRLLTLVMIRMFLDQRNHIRCKQIWNIYTRCLHNFWIKKSSECFYIDELALELRRYETFGEKISEIVESSDRQNVSILVKLRWMFDDMDHFDERSARLLSPVFFLLCLHRCYYLDVGICGALWKQISRIVGRSDDLNVSASMQCRWMLGMARSWTRNLQDYWIERLWAWLWIDGMTFGIGRYEMF